ncbi:SDR family oxidoreductase [soil metagenome]
MLAVTGAAGHLGRAVVRNLLERGIDPGDLVVATRHPGQVGDVHGAHVRHVDFDDVASMRDGFDGVTRLLIISADNVGTRAHQHAAAIDTARDTGVQHVMYTSMLSPGPQNPAVISPSHWATEQHLRASGVPWTILRNSLYSDFQVFEAADAVAAGRFVHNRGAGGCSYISRDDCAAAAAAVLATPGHESLVYEFTGPESLDASALAALYAESAGSPVEAVDIDDDELLRISGGGEGADGHAQYGAELMVSLGQAIRGGHFASVTSTFEELVGTRPMSVREVLAR